MQESFERVVETLVSKYPAYAAGAYEFMRSALDSAADHFCKDSKDRHLSAKELYLGSCSYALDEYGPLAWEVLSFWGITSSTDFGHVVYNLIEVGVFGKQKDDKLEQFYDLPDLREMLQAPYLPPHRADDKQPNKEG